MTDILKNRFIWGIFLIPHANLGMQRSGKKRVFSSRKHLQILDMFKWISYRNPENIPDLPLNLVLFICFHSLLQIEDIKGHISNVTYFII